MLEPPKRVPLASQYFQNMIIFRKLFDAQGEKFVQNPIIKSLVLKYGGPKVYRVTRPFFLGMILGQFVVAGVWIIIDSFTGMTDNNIYWV